MLSIDRGAHASAQLEESAVRTILDLIAEISAGAMTSCWPRSTPRWPDAARFAGSGSGRSALTDRRSAALRAQDDRRRGFEQSAIAVCPCPGCDYLAAPRGARLRHQQLAR